MPYSDEGQSKGFLSRVLGFEFKVSGLEFKKIFEFKVSGLEFAIIGIITIIITILVLITTIIFRWLRWPPRVHGFGVPGFKGFGVLG